MSTARDGRHESEEDDWDAGDDYEPDPWDEAADECGLGQDYEGCMNAGTEYCDFECPFNR